MATPTPTPSEIQAAAREKLNQKIAAPAPEEVEDDLDELDEDEDLDTPAAEADEDEDTDAPAEEEFTPPSKEEWKRTQDRIKKLNAEAKKHRLAAKAAQESTDAEDAVAAARKEVEDKFKTRIVNASLTTALAGAGLTGDPKRILRLADLSNIELDDEGDVDEDDIDEVITNLKAEFPEFFSRTRAPRTSVGRDSEGRAPKPKTPTELQAERAMAGRTR